MSNLNKLKQEDIESILKKLKETNTGTYLDPIDITWGIPNQLVNTMEILLIILTKTSAIPFISDYTEIYTDLGITLEQSKVIQELNKPLLLLHTYIQKYCIQEFIIASFIKKTMDDIILQIPEQDMSHLIDFISNSNQNKSQIGGGLLNKLLEIILLFSCLLLISESTNVPLQLTQNQQYEKGIISISEREFRQGLLDQKRITSGPVDVNNMIVKYDTKTKEKNNNLFNLVIGGMGLGAVIGLGIDGKKMLEDIIEQFNDATGIFSNGAEKMCFELMDMAKKEGIFKDWRDLDSLKETSDQIKDLQHDIAYNYNNLMSNIEGNIMGATLSGLSGDFTNAMAHILNLGGDVTKYIRSSKLIIEEQEEIMNEESQKTIKLSETEKIMLEQKLHSFSKFYCSTGYNLKLALNGTNVDVIGDKIEYSWMINLIKTLESNLQFQISKVAISKDDDKTKKNALNILESLTQRLGVLEAITNSLDDIVNFSLKSKMMTLSEYPTSNTIEEFKEYLKAQIDSLNKQLVQLSKEFPKQESELELLKRQVEEKIRLNSLKEEINEIAENATNIARQKNAERTAKNWESKWEAAKTIGQSWFNTGQDGLGWIGSSIFKLVAAAPKAITQQGFHEIISTLDSILFEIITSPSGLIVMLGGLLTVGFMLGGVGGTIRLFKKGSKLFLAITWGSILYVYELIKTPFGFIYRQRATMFVNERNVPQIENVPLQVQAQNAPLQVEGQNYGPYGQANYSRFQNQQEEGEEYNPNRRYTGGKRRRKTRKNKKKKTHKMKGGKRRQTKHRKNRQTKKR